MRGGREEGASNANGVSEQSVKEDEREGNRRRTNEDRWIS